MHDNHLELVNSLYDKAHRFLQEDEVIDATVKANLSIIDANYIINKLLEKGVYISENLQEALDKNKKEKKSVIKRTIPSRKHAEIPTTFKMLNIPIGSELLFLKDKNIVAITLDNINQIELRDKSLKGSLSAVARILATQYGYADTARQGPRWWIYKGKTLMSIREQLDND